MCNTFFFFWFVKLLKNDHIEILPRILSRTAPKRIHRQVGVFQGRHERDRFAGLKCIVRGATVYR